jgi:protein gp37
MSIHDRNGSQIISPLIGARTDTAIVWLGVTVGAKSSYPRLDILREIPCTLRFISAKPLLEPIEGINLDGIGWVAADGISGSLYEKRAMDLTWSCLKFGSVSSAVSALSHIKACGTTADGS